MDRMREVEAHRASIYNFGFMVRRYARGGHMNQASALAKLRRDAIVALGHAVREIFNGAADADFETYLTALVDCLTSKDDWPRF